MSPHQHTPFHAIQTARGARFVPFAGYELPVQYTGVVAEHQAVRGAAGLFDVSHMGEVVIEGPEALTAVQWLVTNDVGKLVDGKALYTVMCREDGGIVDDLIVYRQAHDSYFLCINGACRVADLEHIVAQTKQFNCRVTDDSDRWAQLALQGPRAEAILARLTALPLATLPAFGFVDSEVAGIAGVRVARTGYTGEPGFELYCPTKPAPQLWAALEEVGLSQGLALCGLGARDTLRLEMKYPLYGSDIDLEHNPLEAGLGWVVKPNKGEFVGRAALQAVKSAGPARKWVGFKMYGRGIPRPGYPIHAQGRPVGLVTSGTHSPSLGEPIGCGYVPTSLSVPGSEFEVIVRERPVPARVVETPFYKRDNG